MRDIRTVYRSPRPFLTIENMGGAQLGNCYHESRWRFTSRLELEPKQIRALLAVLHLEGNAGTDIKGATEPAGFDDVSAVHEDQRTGEVVSRSPLDEFGQPYKTIKQAYYVCDVAVRVDSGD